MMKLNYMLMKLKKVVFNKKIKQGDKMAIHIKDIKQAITLIKETQTSLNRLSKLVTNEDIRTLSKKVNKFLDEIEIDVYSG